MAGRRMVAMACAVALCGLLIDRPAQARDWPCFRGPGRQGVSHERDLPVRWSADENLAWRTAIPAEGWSSPIVYGDRIFLTGTTDEGVSCHVMAVDRRDGRILWNTKVFEQETRRKEQRNSYATPTPVTDGHRVYAVFADGSLVALDFEGRVVWTYREVHFYSQHGLGASPILHEDLLIMPYDGSSDGEDRAVGWQTPWDRAYLLALDRHTGEVRWRGERGRSRIAHVTPNVLTCGGEAQIVSAAGDVIQGFDPPTGRLIWTAFSQGEGVVPSVVIGGGLIFTASGFERPTIRAVRPGGEGDVTETHIAWEQQRGVPMRPSMLYLEPHLYAITDGGVATCYDAETGEIVAQKRMGGNHSASPAYADGHIYFLSEEGETIVVEADPEMSVVARNKLEGRFQASMAVSRGQLILRSDRHLYAVGEPEP